MQPHVDTWYQAQWTDVASRLASRVSFDYVLVHYIFLTRIFEAFPPGVRRIVDTHDSFAELSRRLAEKGVATGWWSCSTRGEVMALRRGEYIMSSQLEETELFKRRLGVHGHVIMVGHPGVWQPLPEAPAPIIGFLASENEMNQAGLAWFVQECWPLVQSEVPEAELLLAGRICRKHGPWSGTSGVRTLGPVADSRDFHALTTVEINPVFAGSGLKVKTIESLSFGRALVSVSEGVAGLSRDYGAFIVADTPKAFADAIIELLREKSARAALITGAERLISDWNIRQRSALVSLFAGL